MNRPKPLQKSANIALISPSHQLSAAQLQTAINQTTSLGLNVAYLPPLRKFGYFAGTAEERAQEITSAFLSNEIDGIFVIRGGSGILGLLDRLDYALLATHPKILLGLSDVTGLHMALTKFSQMMTFHGPNASLPWVPYTRKSIQQVLFEDMSVKYDFSGETSVYSPQLGQAKGRFIGGNLATIISLIGTPYEPDWQDTILFLEDINEDLYKIERMFQQLILIGAFQKIKGLVLGTFTNCLCRTNGCFEFKDILIRLLRPLQIPILAGIPAGHEENQIILPMGADVTIDTEKKYISFSL